MFCNFSGSGFPDLIFLVDEPSANSRLVRFRGGMAFKSQIQCQGSKVEPVTAWKSYKCFNQIEHFAIEETSRRPKVEPATACKPHTCFNRMEQFAIEETSRWHETKLTGNTRTLSARFPLNSTKLSTLSVPIFRTSLCLRKTGILPSACQVHVADVVERRNCIKQIHIQR